jgi:hypothetical protein
VTQAAPDVLLAPLDALDRADMPRAVKDSLRSTLVAIHAAYAEDDDPQKIPPDTQSFVRLLRFLQHPHRWSWRAPALSVNPEGEFSAVWDDPGVNRWLLTFKLGDKIESVFLATLPDGRIEYNSRALDPGEEVQPPFAIG